ncbi:hypothetical protein KDA_69370 [Dictyobacter alpinus]|uniref:N-acetyltransferase domain-containing protein n=1 Tax=Dictyobacter alpinus TaxID=2014873 RepID=A0A402BJE7_9CHLR|nr:GNAT family protein [Dictyobacter alpinus]GCE31453.1 hypothetical protein KDA_69370 [Dictyobacter alpinus]
MHIRIPGLQIYLRDWQLADLEQYRAWMVPGQRWKEFEGPYYPLPTADVIATNLAYIRSQIEQDTFPTIRSVLVISDKTTDRLLGIVTWNWESQETHWPSVGIVIFDPAYWEQGRGFEALGLWSEYLFFSLPTIARLDLRTWSGNKGMVALAGKLGYLQEACFRKARTVHGAYYDSLGYGILRKEWEARYPQGFGAYLQEYSNQQSYTNSAITR